MERESIQISGIIHLIGHIFMMQMFYFQFPVLIRPLELISIPNHGDSLILIKLNTLHSWKEKCESQFKLVVLFT